MSLASQVAALATRVSVELKSVRTALAGKSDTTHGHVLTDPGITGTLALAKGGSGNAFGALPPGAVITAASTTAFGVTAAGTAGQVLQSAAAAAPVWVTLDKTAVGLANVDNTSDLGKPVSTATTTQLNLKAPLASPAFSGTVTGVTAAMVGLGNVSNAAQEVLANKSIATALGASDTLYPSQNAVKTYVDTGLALKAPLASPAFTGTPTGITKAHVGLGSVDNTADSAKAFAASQVTSGTVATARLGTGTASSTTYLRGDQTWAAVASGGGLLGYKEYNPTSTANYSTTSGSVVDVDATNLAVTFTAPPTGVVVVSLESLAYTGSGGNGYQSWALKNGTTTVGIPRIITNVNSATYNRYATGITVPGLTPGVSYTFKWGWSVTNLIAATLTGGGGNGPFTMLVWSA